MTQPQQLLDDIPITREALERVERMLERLLLEHQSLADEKFRSLRELLVTERERLKELVFARFEAERTALALQAKEYERRLEDLNHAHDLATQVQARTLDKEVFERFVVGLNHEIGEQKDERNRLRETDKDSARRELEAAKAEIGARLNALEKQTTQSTGERRGRGDGIGMIVTGLGVVLTLLSIGGIILALRGNPTPASQQPIYVPVPQGTLAPQPANPGTR